MADDVTLNTGSGGAVIATDEISSRHFQKMKLVYGADGTADDVDDDIAAHGVPVKALDGAIAALGTTTDSEATGNGTLIAIAKRLRTLLSGGLPAALSALGGLKVDLINSLDATNDSVTAEFSAALKTMSTAYANNLMVKSGAGTLYGFTVHNKNATTTLYVGLFDATTETGTALNYWTVYPKDQVSVTFPDKGLPMATGIYLEGFTDDDGTNTDSGSDLWFLARYK